MSTTIEGLRFIYGRPQAVNDPVINRTVLPLPAADMTRKEARKNAMPQFYSTINPASSGEFSPAPDKEIEWLEAFLSACTYISEMDEEWRPGKTIGAYWKAHI